MGSANARAKILVLAVLGLAGCGDGGGGLTGAMPDAGAASIAAPAPTPAADSRPVPPAPAPAPAAPPGSVGAPHLPGAGQARPQQAGPYRVTELGVLPHQGHSTSWGAGINRAGVVVGTSWGMSTLPLAFLWQASTGMVNPSSGDTLLAAAHAVNDKGQIAGSVGWEIGSRAALWQPGTGLLELGMLPGDSESFALDVNNVAQVVGGRRRDDRRVAFVWQADAGMFDLGGTIGGFESLANGINDAGQVVGWRSVAADRSRAFLWQRETGLMDLGTLPGAASSAAYDINGSGQVVGVSGTESRSRAFLWHASTGMVDLGALPGDVGSAATRIDEAGVVYGSSVDAASNTRAVVWKDGRIIALQDLLDPADPLQPSIRLRGAFGSDANGRIAANASIPGVGSRAVLLTPK